MLVTPTMHLDPVVSAPIAVNDSRAACQYGRHSRLETRVERLHGVPDPLAFLAAASASLGHGVFWSQQASGITYAGAGNALRLTGSGNGRFAEMGEALSLLRDDLAGDDGEIPFPLLGGFAFDAGAARSSRWADFPDGALAVPSVLLQLHDDRAYLRITLPVNSAIRSGEYEEQVATLARRARAWLAVSPPAWHEPSIVETRAIPPQHAWEATVADAVERIERGDVAKVVLAREERLQGADPFSPIAALEHLRDTDPSATHFAVASGSSWFLGATPERLVRLQEGRVDVTCLAGSIGIGNDPDERAELARQLLGSAKDREEHEIVVRATMQALREVCDRVERAPGTPRVVAARSVQHLMTPVTARLAGNGQILDLVDRLHPTPAVGGQPKAPAMELIRQLESIDRGWYAGPVGWATPDGSGEFDVAIRSALLSGDSASLFAGCGIVADSRPQAEFAETELKLRPMRATLGIA
jgi:isochorismate synthase